MMTFNQGAGHTEPEPIKITFRRVLVFTCSLCGDFETDDNQEVDVFGDRRDSIMYSHFNEVHKVKNG